MANVLVRSSGALLACLAMLTLLPQCTPDTLEDFTAGKVVDGGGDTKDGGGSEEDGGYPDLPPPTCVPGVKECGPHFNPCRAYVCTVDGECLEETIKDGVGCDDGKACTIDTNCDGGKCVNGTPKDCDDDDDCTLDTCNAKSGGCVHDAAKDGTTCDPAQTNCWSSGSCFEGKCVGQTALCKCHPEWQDDNDPVTPKCPELVVDGDKCQGMMYCKKTAPASYACVTNPATVVECTDKNDTECRKNVCNKELAKCEMINSEENSFCDDGDECTKNSKCLGGQCKITDFDKDLICKCTPKHLDKCINEQGVDPCDGILYCDNYPNEPTCKQANKVECSTAEDTTCLKNTCNSKNGECQMTKALPTEPGGTVYCDDGGECTPNDKCEGGLCAPGTPNICPCNKDADCGAKDDGSFCNGVLFCDHSGKSPECKLNPASVVNCTTVNDTVCVKNHCFPKTGKCALIPVKNLKTIVTTSKNKAGVDVKTVNQKAFPYAVNAFISCSDGNDCTVNDQCIGASCKPGTTNTCICTKDEDCLAQDDGNLCNGVQYCDKLAGKCKPNPSTLVTCGKTDNTQCQANICDPKKGKCVMTPAKEGQLCDDENACSVNESCSKGMCTTQNATFTCNCTKNADCTLKEDGDLCNGTLYCDKVNGKCQVNPATVIKCASNKDTQCTKNLCEPKSGLCKITPVNDNILCDDGDSCTASPVCAQGKCFSETNICQCKSKSDCAPFEDGNACTGTLYCDNSNGMCKTNPASIVNCFDTKDTACSKSTCDPKDGKCKMAAVADNVILCEDGDPCTQFDFCNGGKCTKGTNTCQCKEDADCATIDDSDLCDGKLFCDKSDPKAFRCVLQPNSKVVCAADEASSCLTETCNTKTGKCESKDKGSCDDKNACTLDLCNLDGDDEGECKHSPAPDGSSADVGKVCIGGVSKLVPKDTAFVPAGDLWMGCNPAIEECKNFPKTEQHKVKISAFWIDVYEVRTSRYLACFNSGKCVAPSLNLPGCNYGVAGRESHPMNCLSHAEAAAFCAWDGGKRLPTEAEWEKAARGGCKVNGGASDCKDKTRTYVWGDAPEPTCSHAVMSDAKGDGCGDGISSAVASLAQTDVSPYGVFDLAGNVREFVADFFDDDFYSKKAATNDDAKNMTKGSYVVVRGGGWKSTSVDVRAAHRGKELKNSNGVVDIGFRCAASL